MNVLPKEFDPHHSVEVQLKVSRYDLVASMLVSMLIMVGVSVMLMCIIWMTKTLVFRPPEPIVTPVNNVGRQDDTAGFARDMAALGLEELPELIEPQLAVELQAVTDALSVVTASIHALEPGHVPTKIHDPPHRVRRDDGHDDIVPRSERWQIHWTSAGLRSYTRQLDFFKIELGAAGGKPDLDYAFNLSKERPDTRQGASPAEPRLYMTWKGGKLVEFDRAILARAGISTPHRLVLQFYPEKVEDRLAWIELQNAARMGHTEVREFRKTFFGVRPKGRDYEFYVEDQQFRAAPR